MTTFDRMMQDYESIHRNPVNRAIHAIGIPLIIVSVQGLGALVHIPGAPLVNMGLALAIATVAITLSWSRRAGLAYAALVALCIAAATAIAANIDPSLRVWTFAALFVAGWSVQFIGHAFEGKSPQFVNRPQNLLLGPIAVMAELVPTILRNPEPRS